MKENLKKYNEKRNFKKTKEPIGKKERSKKLRFVVQHHMAKKDHYDLLLEAAPDYENDGFIESFDE